MGNKITRKCLSIDERYTRPQGLYPQRNVNKKKLRRLILNSKLAPCFPGEEESNVNFEECPICFLYYPSLNRSKCCSKGVCTECFLQMKSSHAAQSTQCPFCKFHNYSVEYRGTKTLEEKGIEVVEEQKFIEAKICMRKQEFLDSEREQEFIQQKASKDGLTNRTFEEISKSQYDQAIHIEIPQQVTFIFNIEKWKQNLCEPNYCYDQQWLQKPCGPSLSIGPSSFRTCGFHCEPNYSKCLMTSHKRRDYDMLDVATPQPKMLKTNQIEPFMGRWQSTWENHQSPLSQSFPLPTRRQDCHTKTFKPTTLEHHSHDIPSNFDGMFVCMDPKIQNTNNLTQEYITSNMSPKSNLSHVMDSSLVCEEYKSDSSLVSTPTFYKNGQSTKPFLSNNKLCKNIEFTMLKNEARLTPINNSQQRDNEFDLDLEEIMVMEAIWQSIQDQQIHHGDTTCELPQIKTNQHTDINTTFQVNNDLQEKSKVQFLHVEAMDCDQHHHLIHGKARGLASAIAALAERQAIKNDVISKLHEFSNEIFPCENEPINNDELGELRSQSHNEMNVRNDYKVMNKDLLYKNCNKKELPGDSGLHALAESLKTFHEKKKCLETLTNEVEQSEVFLKSCQIDQGFDQVEDGASSSTHSAHSNSAIYVPDASSQNVKGNRCGCNTNGHVMLPKSFEEQMMLAMALSVIDSH